jgi:hypothetical protein
MASGNEGVYRPVSIELIVWRDTPIASASWPWAMSRWVRSARTRFFIAYPTGPLRPRRQRRPAPGHDATTTAGSQPTETMGPQLPSLIAATIELTATNATTSAASPYHHHRLHGFMAILLL